MGKDKENPFYKWIYGPIIAPIILLIVGSAFVGKLVIQITGFQLNIGLTVLVIIIIFIVMIASFILGIGYFGFVLISIFTKKDMPLVYRVATYIIVPVFWVYEKFQSRETREEDKEDIGEIKNALKQWQGRVKKEQIPPIPQ